MAKRLEKITYTVTFNAASKRWNVARNGVATGAFAMQMAAAVGSAYGAASR